MAGAGGAADRRAGPGRALQSDAGPRCRSRTPDPPAPARPAAGRGAGGFRAGHQAPRGLVVPTTVSAPCASCSAPSGGIPSTVVRQRTNALVQCSPMATLICCSSRSSSAISADIASLSARSCARRGASRAPLRSRAAAAEPRRLALRAGLGVPARLVGPAWRGPGGRAGGLRPPPPAPGRRSSRPPTSVAAAVPRASMASGVTAGLAGSSATRSHRGGGSDGLSVVLWRTSVARIAQKARSRMVSRPGNSARRASAAARLTTPRIPAQDSTATWLQGGMGSRSRRLRDNARGSQVAGNS